MNMFLSIHRGEEGYMEHNTHREAGGAAHPQNPCSLGVLGLLSRGQEIPCHEASSVRIQVLLVHLHSQGWVGWNQPGPCIFPRQTRVSVLPPLLLPLWSSTEIGNQAGKLAGRGIPDSQGFIITHSGADGQIGMCSQTPHLSFHVSL